MVRCVRLLPSLIRLLLVPNTIHWLFGSKLLYLVVLWTLGLLRFSFLARCLRLLRLVGTGIRKLWLTLPIQSCRDTCNSREDMLGEQVVLLVVPLELVTRKLMVVLPKMLGLLRLLRLSL